MNEVGTPKQLWENTFLCFLNHNALGVYVIVCTIWSLKYKLQSYATTATPWSDNNDNFVSECWRIVSRAQAQRNGVRRDATLHSALPCLLMTLAKCIYQLPWAILHVIIYSMCMLHFNLFSMPIKIKGYQIEEVLLRTSPFLITL